MRRKFTESSIARAWHIAIIYYVTVTHEKRYPGAEKVQWVKALAEQV